MEKTLKLVLLNLIFATISCTVEDENILVQGQLVREINEIGISNEKLTLKMGKIKGHGLFSSTYYIDKKEVFTDENGYFSAYMQDVDNTFITIDIENANHFVEDIIKSYNPSEFIKLKRNYYLDFKVILKNVNPFNDADYVEINFYSGLHQNFITHIENFGIQNFQTPPEYLIGGGVIGAQSYPIWIGQNVYSNIYFKVPENSNHFKMMKKVKKNNIETFEMTDDIPYEYNQINEFHINY